MLVGRGPVNLVVLAFEKMEVIPDPNGLDSLTVVAPEFDASFELSGSAPVQAFVTVLGRQLYFRARPARRHDPADLRAGHRAGRAG
jgi:hypothetical protein